VSFFLHCQLPFSFFGSVDLFSIELCDSCLQLADKLTSYKELYETATEFITRRDLWMDGQVGSHDPDEIDANVGTCYQTICKLEKVFTEQPAVKDLTSTVSTCFLLPSAADYHQIRTVLCVYLLCINCRKCIK
jgi:hypothetical protein